jgi:hypothetical protein
MTKVNTSRRNFLIRARRQGGRRYNGIAIVKLAGARVLTERHLKEPMPAIQESGYWHFPGS